jgi:hypothetical protein
LTEDELHIFFKMDDGTLRKTWWPLDRVHEFIYPVTPDVEFSFAPAASATRQ